MLWWFHHILEMSDNPIKPVSWIGASYKDFRAFPDPVQDTMGYALYRAQIGAKHESAKPLKGFGGQGCSKSSPIMWVTRFAPSIR